MSKLSAGNQTADWNSGERPGYPAVLPSFVGGEGSPMQSARSGRTVCTLPTAQGTYYGSGYEWYRPMLTPS